MHRGLWQFSQFTNCKLCIVFGSGSSASDHPLTRAGFFFASFSKIEKLYEVLKIWWVLRQKFPAIFNWHLFRWCLFCLRLRYFFKFGFSLCAQLDIIIGSKRFFFVAVYYQKKQWKMSVERREVFESLRNDFIVVDVLKRLLCKL